MTQPGDPHALHLLSRVHALEAALRAVLVYAEANPPTPNPPIHCDDPACIGCQSARHWRAALIAAHAVLETK